MGDKGRMGRCILLYDIVRLSPGFRYILLINVLVKDEGMCVSPVLENGLHGGEEAGRALDQTREDKLEPKTRHTRQEAGYGGETTLNTHQTTR